MTISDEQALHQSTMRSCRDCLTARMCKTDHPVSEMIFTRQGYKCKFHAERWKRKDKMRSVK